MLRLSTNQNWNMGMMNNIIADGAHDCSADRALTAGTTDDQGSFLFFCNFTDGMSWLAAFYSNLARNLKQKYRRYIDAVNS